jgi:hypothetical protein
MNLGASGGCGLCDARDLEYRAALETTPDSLVRGRTAAAIGQHLRGVVVVVLIGGVHAGAWPTPEPWCHRTGCCAVDPQGATLLRIAEFNLRKRCHLALPIREICPCNLNTFGTVGPRVGGKDALQEVH